MMICFYYFRIARFSPDYCTDCLRWKTLGLSEAEWWEHYLLSFPDTDGPTNVLIESFFVEHVFPNGRTSLQFLLSKEMKSDQTDEIGSQSPMNSFSTLVEPNVIPILDGLFVRLRNPGFYDPFDCKETITLKNYGGWYTGKLDWTLLRNMIVLDKKLGNGNFTASDHAWLLLDCQFDNEGLICDQIISRKRFERIQRELNRKRAQWHWYAVGFAAIAFAGSLLFRR
jgi:hypothetical protein